MEAAISRSFKFVSVVHVIFFLTRVVLLVYQLFVTNLEKFHAEADKDYWKSIAELLPKEAVPGLEKKKGKKDAVKKPSIITVKGPKPGRPTDLSRMQHLISKLKTDAPSHLKLSSPAVMVAVKGPNDTSVTTDTKVVIAA